MYVRCTANCDPRRHAVCIELGICGKLRKQVTAFRALYQRGISFGAATS